MSPSLGHTAQPSCLLLCWRVGPAHPQGLRGAVNNDIGWLADGQPDPAVGGKSVDLRPLYAELSEQLRVIVYNGDVDGQCASRGSYARRTAHLS